MAGRQTGHQARGLALNDLEGQITLALEEPLQVRVKMTAAISGEETQAQATLISARSFGHPVDGAVQFTHRPLRAAHEFLTRGGQLHAVRSTLEDLCAESGLQFVNAARNGRLLDPKSAGGAPEAAMLGCGEHVAELVQPDPGAGAGMTKASAIYGKRRSVEHA